MKIKRYEASSMTEALRKVKKDFGEDAVILSAKTAKKSTGIFSVKNGSKVVVTAAIDIAPTGKKRTAAIKAKTNEDIASMAVSDSEKTREPVADQVSDTYEAPASFETPAPAPNPEADESELPKRFIKQPRRLVPFKRDPVCTTERKPSLSTDLYKKFRTEGLNSALSHELADHINQLAGSCSIGRPQIKEALAALIEERGWVTTPADTSGSAGNPIVLVGVHGSGKTTTAVKLAADALLGSQKDVTILSLDYQRIAAHVELKRAAYVMGIELMTASSAQQLQELLPQIPKTQNTIIDTTGVAIGEEAALEELASLLAHLGEVEIHLVLNACLQETVAARTIDFYSLLGVDRLLFTHTDNTDNIGHLFNLIENHGLPVSYMGHGAQVPGGLYMMSAENAAEMLLPAAVVAADKLPTNSDEESSVDVLHDEQPQASGKSEQTSPVEIEQDFQPLFKQYR